LTIFLDSSKQRWIHSASPLEATRYFTAAQNRQVHPWCGFDLIRQLYNREATAPDLRGAGGGRAARPARRLAGRDQPFSATRRWLS
jgi:hypothetical protein